MSMRFRPANIRVINRRVSAKAIIGPAVQNLLKAHQQEHVLAPPPVNAVPVPERCSQSRVRFAAPNYGAPLTAKRRSGQVAIATGGSGGNMRYQRAKHEKPKPGPGKLDKVAPYQFSDGSLSDRSKFEGIFCFRGVMTRRVGCIDQLALRSACPNLGID
jgi:hypothetical protein